MIMEETASLSFKLFGSRGSICSSSQFASGSWSKHCPIMASRFGVSTDKSSQPGGPYSQAVVVDKMVFVAGQLGFEPTSGDLVPGGIVPETRQTFANMVAVLEAAGSSIRDVVKMTVLLKTLDDFEAMNQEYREWFKGCDPLPARTTFQAGEMPKNSRIEVDCIAILRV